MENLNNVVNLSNFTDSISIANFIFKVLLVSVLSYFLGLVYLKFGRSLSNRASLSNSFPLLGLATMSIITVVKSSLALSLGLVGALSIVRFRTPIKEPEELIYLFLCITLGLATGADQYLISIVILIGTFILNILLKKTRINSISKEGAFNVFISSTDSVSTNQIIDLFKKNCSSINLKRYSGEVDNSNIEITLAIIIKEYSILERLKRDLYDLSPKIKVDFIDCSNIQG